MKADDNNGRSLSPLTKAFTAAGLLDELDFALFWDFASLYQKPRAPHEERLFLPGLRASNIWCAGRERWQPRDPAPKHCVSAGLAGTGTRALSVGCRQSCHQALRSE